MLKKFKFVPVLLVLIIIFENSYAKILMQPYLQAVTENSIYVMVESDKKNDVTVLYGSDSKYGKENKTEFYVKTEYRKNTYVHRIKLSGLEPSTVYHYRVISDNDTSNDASFRTAARPGTSFRFACMGDCRSNPDIHSQIAKKIKAENPYFSLYGGDICFSSEYFVWKEEFFIPAERDLISSVPFFNAVGNHEGWRQNTKAFQQSPEKENKPYYSFDYGDVHILILNTEQSAKEGSEQWNFVKKDLESTMKKWKVVCFHKPAYCAGGHGDNTEMQIMSHKLFVPNKVDIVVTGHTHIYQHNLVDGIHHFVLAGGGAPLYNFKTADYVVKSAKEYHYAIVDVTPNNLRMIVYDLKGNELDKLELGK